MAHLSHSAIDAATLGSGLQSAERGASVTFVGLVRDHHGGRRVTGLAYSAYEPMAEEECARIVAEAEARWPASVGLTHRLGSLEIGDVAVAVVATAAHREAAFEACRYVIEAVKVRVPVWKRERYEDGSEAWVDPTTAGGTVPTAASAE